MNEIKSVKVRDSEMNYFKFGSGSKDMVIIPGLSIKSVMYSAGDIKASYGLFADDFTVYVLDRIKDVPKVYTIYEMAMDTAEAMDKLGIKNACVFGASQGGMIAQIIASERADLIDKMVLCSTAARIPDDTKLIFDKIIGYAKNGDGETLSLEFAKIVYSDELFEKYQKFFADLGRHTTEDELERFVRMCSGLDSYDCYDKLENVKCETLVIGSAADRIFGSATSDEIAQKLGCELYIYDGFSHAVYDEAPDIKQRIYEFFRK